VATRDVPHISTFMENHKAFPTPHVTYENVKNVPRCSQSIFNRWFAKLWFYSDGFKKRITKNAISFCCPV
jgi:hypothetical protein